MRTRTKLVGTASAALITAAMVIAPCGAFAAAPPSPGSSSTPDPNGPFAPGHPGAGISQHSEGASAYKPNRGSGFKTSDSSGSGDANKKLGTTDAKLLQQAQVAKKKTVTVMMIAGNGATDDVVAAVKKAGGSVGSVTESLGYVRATVPTESVSGLAAMSIVKAIDLDRTYKVPAPDLGTPGAVPSTRAAGPSAPGPDTPAANPYLPIDETGATSFIDANPTWDGRGTTVGILDTGVDIEHPALQKTSDGKPKIVDWVTETDPVSDGDGSWVRMGITKTGPSFSYVGYTWTAPPGTYQMGFFYEGATAGSELNGDVNDNGTTLDRFGVLYDPATHRIWVDSNNNHDFTDEPAMTDYAVDHQIGHFGTDNPATPENERIPFVVQHRDNVDLSALGGSSVGMTANYVNIGLPAEAHATHVAGIIAGTSMLGGAMHGAAPGAQIVSARACSFSGGCTQAALTEGMIDLVTNRHVDVVNLSVGGLSALNDGSDVISSLYNQLIDQYGVQIVVAAGNDGLGTNTVSSPSVATKAISVAASVSSDTWWADYGSKVSVKQNIFGFSSRGPAENGALAPQVSAPGAAVSSIPMWLAGQAVPEAGYPLPAGYAMENGTSMATPEVTGAAALLLSAAKATSKSVSPAALRTALTGTAQLIPGVPTTAQGAGIIDTVAAWKQLAQNVSVNGLSVSAPVCTSLSGLLATPNTGPGLYNRCLPAEGGQVTGVQKDYKIHVTRTSGATGNVVHQIGWIGNDGTFSARAALPLQLGKPADVTVTATAKTSGVHTAIMTIDDPATVGIDQFVSVTVMATTALTGPDYTVTTSGMLSRTTATAILVPVPKGVEALQTTLGGLADGSQVRILPIDPDGVPAVSNASNHCYTNYADPAHCNATSAAVYRPKAGVWEFVIESRRTSATDANTYSASVSLEGMSFNPGQLTVPSAQVNTPQALSTEGTNTFAPVQAHVADGEIGRQENLVATVADGDLTANQIDVPRGASRLDMTVTPRDASADVDMYVISPTGQLAGTSDTAGPGAERIILDDPQPGSYFLVVGGVHSATGSTTFDYHQEMFSAGLGTVTPSSTSTVTLGAGETMPVDVSMSLAALPLTNDPMVARVDVANAYGTTIGAAAVSITSVTMPKLDLLKWEKPFVGGGMNDSGVIAGDHQVNSRMTPTIWTAQNGFSDLPLSVGKYGSALGINNDQTAVGIVTDAGSHYVPAQWAKDGTLTLIGEPTLRPYTSGYATAVNNGGTSVGFSQLTIKESDGKFHNYSDGFVHNTDGTFGMLDHLSSADLTGDEPLAVNDSGTAVGVSLTADHAPHAVAWDVSTGAVHDLGTLPGQSSSQANDINAGGTVVGTSGDDAFVWTKNGGMRRLADYGFNATGEKITDDGWILGTVELFPDYPVAAMWDPQGRLWDLSGMVPLDAGTVFLPSAGFDINNNHQLMIYGEGGPNGATSSTVMLHIPDDLGK